MMNLKKKKAFTLVEVLTVMIIIGIVLAIFSSTFGLNFDALTTYISRTDMWKEADTILDSITLDGRNAEQIIVDPTNQIATLTDNTGAAFAVYTINADRTLTVVRNGGVPQVLTGFAVPGDGNLGVGTPTSFFTLVGTSLVVNLTLSEQLVGRTAQVIASTEVFPR